MLVEGENSLVQLLSLAVSGATFPGVIYSRQQSADWLFIFLLYIAVTNELRGDARSPR